MILTKPWAINTDVENANGKMRFDPGEGSCRSDTQTGRELYQGLYQDVLLAIAHRLLASSEVIQLF